MCRLPSRRSTSSDDYNSRLKLQTFFTRIERRNKIIEESHCGWSELGYNYLLLLNCLLPIGKSLFLFEMFNLRINGRGGTSVSVFETYKRRLIVFNQNNIMC